MMFFSRISVVAVSAVVTLAVAASASAAVPRPAAGEWKGETDGTSVSFHVVHHDVHGLSHTIVEDVRVNGSSAAYDRAYVDKDNRFEVCKSTQLQAHSVHWCFEGHFVSAHEAVGARKNFFTTLSGHRFGTVKTYPWTARHVSHGAGAAATAAVATRDFTFNIHWGGFLRTAGRHDNLCENLGIEPGGHARIKVRASREVVTPPDNGTDRDATLVCAPMLDIWGHTAGPWDPNAPGGPGWLSIRCPANEQPMTNGAGYSTNPHPHVTQVDGGFGHNHDGYWHYRFHNWSGQTVRIQFWGVCSEYGQTGGVNGG